MPGFCTLKNIHECQYVAVPSVKWVGYLKIHCWIRCNG